MLIRCCQLMTLPNFMCPCSSTYIYICLWCIVRVRIAVENYTLYDSQTHAKMMDERHHASTPKPGKWPRKYCTAQYSTSMLKGAGIPWHEACCTFKYPWGVSCWNAKRAARFGCSMNGQKGTPGRGYPNGTTLPAYTVDTSMVDHMHSEDALNAGCMQALYIERHSMGNQWLRCPLSPLRRSGWL